MRDWKRRRKGRTITKISEKVEKRVWERKKWNEKD